MKYYTIGQIFRLGLLKSRTGEPYKDKAAISRIVRKMDFIVKKTKWGTAKTITSNQIKKYNEQ